MKKVIKIYCLAVVCVVLGGCNRGETIRRVYHGIHPATPHSSPYSDRVIEYTPAPGQFINHSGSGFTGNETTPALAAEYAAGRLKDKNMPDENNTGSYVSLGGFGGYIVVGFDHSIENWGSCGGYDFSIRGNQFQTSSEPGVVWVMQDLNGSGIPGDSDGEVWYELRGALYSQSVHNYEVTYYKPSGPRENIRWTDNAVPPVTGEILYGTLDDSEESYYPLWITEESYTLSGTLLPSKAETVNGNFTTGSYGWGYADNWSKTDMLKTGRNYFRISDAVKHNGTPANLKYIDFIKVQTGLNVQGGGGVGELSTEVFEFRDENIGN